MLDGGNSGIFSQIFSEKSVVLMLFGAMGGAVRSAALKTTWREGVRVTFIGAVTAFGVGELAPVVLKPWIGELPEGLSGTVGAISSLAFVTGLVAVVLIERLVAGGNRDGREN